MNVEYMSSDEPNSSTFEFRLPEFGEGVVEGEIREWLVAIGDEVSEDQPIVSILTDMDEVEILSPVHGVVTNIVGNVGETIRVGAVYLELKVWDTPVRYLSGKLRETTYFMDRNLGGKDPFEVKFEAFMEAIQPIISEGFGHVEFTPEQMNEFLRAAGFDVDYGDVWAPWVFEQLSADFSFLARIDDGYVDEPRWIEYSETEGFSEAISRTNAECITMFALAWD